MGAGQEDNNESFAIKKSKKSTKNGKDCITKYAKYRAQNEDQTSSKEAAILKTPKKENSQPERIFD